MESRVKRDPITQKKPAASSFQAAESHIEAVSEIGLEQHAWEMCLLERDTIF